MSLKIYHAESEFNEAIVIAENETAAISMLFNDTYREARCCHLRLNKRLGNRSTSLKRRLKLSSCLNDEIPFVARVY